MSDGDLLAATLTSNIDPNNPVESLATFDVNESPSLTPAGGAITNASYPASLAGTAFDGQFEAIGASGVGPLHTPNFGQNDFVFDASGTRVDINDQTPVCGVYRNYAFQIYDQDEPAQPIHDEGMTITENLSAGPPVATTANNVGQALDTHGAVRPDRCLTQNEFSDITQTFVVSAAGRSFNLTTAFHIKVGNINGQLTESTEVTHQ